MDEGLLIDLVERHSFLYDKKSKNAPMKENAYEEISGAMGQTIDKCQRVWRNLRDRFVRERRFLKARPSGAAAVDEPKWSLYERLMFLVKHIASRRTTSNVSRPPSRPTSAASNISSTEVLSPYNTILTIVDTNQSQTTSVSLSDEESEEARTLADNDVAGTSSAFGPATPSTAGTSVPPGQRRKKQSEKIDERIAAAMEGMADHLKSGGKKPSSSHTFVAYIESRLGELTPYKRKEAPRQILQLLDETEDE